MAKEHFNKGNDCDTCVHKFMYVSVKGNRDDAQACSRQEAGLDCQYQEREVRICPVCEKEVYRDEMQYTRIWGGYQAAGDNVLAVAM